MFQTKLKFTRWRIACRFSAVTHGGKGNDWQAQRKEFQHKLNPIVARF
jgi:hypothetical protein